MKNEQKKRHLYTYGPEIKNMLNVFESNKNA